jgi:hypothetical protein
MALAFEITRIQEHRVKKQVIIGLNGGLSKTKPSFRENVVLAV